MPDISYLNFRPKPKRTYQGEEVPAAAYLHILLRFIAVYEIIDCVRSYDNSAGQR